jgi:metallo-beta-lactamase family protein
LDIQFLGATREVTGSCMLIRVGGQQVLLECGLLQGGRQHETHNQDNFLFDPLKIDAVVVSHAHLDHSGRVPLLSKRGYRGPVYSHQATMDLCEIMWADSGFLNEKAIEWENRKRHKKGLSPLEPLYSQSEARQAHEQVDGLAFGSPREILPGVKLTFHDAGHILGSSIVELVLTENGESRKLVFSGDLGHSGAPILRDPEVVHEADLVILESTYGDRLHRQWEETWEEMGSVLSGAHAKKGNVVIPSFTVGRTQELLYVFNRYFEDWNLGDWQIYVDSPMAIKATEVYKQYGELYDKGARELARKGGVFELPNLHFCQSAEESMKVNGIGSGAIIIAGSGMCTGGRIKHHLKYNVSKKDSHILIVGFQARGTPGRALVDGAKQIRLFGEEKNVAATVHTIGGLSAHADQQGLLDWYGNFKGRPPLYLVHGEEEAMAALKQEADQRFSFNAEIAEFEQRVNL